jgi:hypothetical protein
VYRNGKAVRGTGCIQVPGQQVPFDRINPDDEEYRLSDSDECSCRPSNRIHFRSPYGFLHFGDKRYDYIHFITGGELLKRQDYIEKVRGKLLIGKYIEEARGELLKERIY